MAVYSNLYLLMSVLASNFAFILVDPEKQTKSELLNSTHELMLSLALFSLLLTALLICFFKKSSSSFLASQLKKTNKLTNENEVTQLTTERSSMKDLNAKEDNLLQNQAGGDDLYDNDGGYDEKVEEPKLGYTQQLVGVLKDPTFVLLVLSSMIMQALSSVYTDNLNAMAATYGFLEVKIIEKI